jgi:hypothetical protein
MRDREAINRFCAFKLLGPNTYRGDMDTFLAKGLAALASCSATERDELYAQFENAMTLNEELFAEHAFRKSLANGQAATRSVINISLFEVCSVAMAGLGQLGKKKKTYLRAAIVELLKDANFANSITYSTNSTTQVRARFGRMEAVVAELEEAGK